MAGDWLRLYRKSLDSRVFSDDWLWRLWCWCLMHANWKTTWKDGRELLPGQFTVGRNEAAVQLNVSPSRFYRGLQTLSHWGQIQLEANNRFTVVTICNWTTYQPEGGGERTASEQPVNSQRTAAEHLADTPLIREEVKEGKKERPPPNPPRGEPEFPEPLNTPRFREYWSLWEQHRKENRHALKPTTRKSQLAELAALGEQEAIARIEQSIRQGWQGLFPVREVKATPTTNGKTPFQQSVERALEDIKCRQNGKTGSNTTPPSSP